MNSAIKEKIYIFLCVLFSILFLLSNLFYKKFIYIAFTTKYGIEISAGILVYPLTFFITDIISEFYGKDKAQFCIKLAILMNLLAAMLIYIIINLNSPGWSENDANTFETLFSAHSVVFFSSVSAFFISQFVDIKLYLWIKKLTKEEWILLRSTVSTTFALLIDSFIVINLMSFFEILPSKFVSKIIISSFLYKICSIILVTPIFMICVYILRGYFKKN